MKSRDPKVNHFLKMTSIRRTKINHNKLFIDPFISKAKSPNLVDAYKVKDPTQRSQLNSILNSERNSTTINYRGLGKKSHFQPDVIDESILIKYNKLQYLAKYKSLLKMNSSILLIRDTSPFFTDVNISKFLNDHIKPIKKSCWVESLNIELFSSLIEEDTKLKNSLENLNHQKNIKALIVPTLKLSDFVNIIRTFKESLNENHYKLFAIYLNLEKSADLTKKLLSILDKEQHLIKNDETINYNSLLKKAISTQSDSQSNSNEVEALKALKLLGENGFLNVDVGSKSISFIKGI